MMDAVMIYAITVTMVSGMYDRWVLLWNMYIFIMMRIVPEQVDSDCVLEQIGLDCVPEQVDLDCVLE